MKGKGLKFFLTGALLGGIIGGGCLTFHALQEGSKKDPPILEELTLGLSFGGFLGFFLGGFFYFVFNIFKKK